MKYFSIEELVKSASAERLAIDNTPPRAACQMLTILVEQLLDPIRRRYGAPIIVTSGYRCPALNTAVGGVANSHHIVGCAADIVASPSPSQGGGPSSAVSESPLLGPTRKSVGCDEERFISPEESRLRVFGRGRLPSFTISTTSSHWSCAGVRVAARRARSRGASRRDPHR